MNNASKIIIGLIIALAIIGGGFFLFSRQGEAPSDGKPTDSTKPSIPAELFSGKEVSITATDNKFTPNAFEITSGEKVRITFNNNGLMLHNLTINELGLATTNIAPGDSTTLEFTAPAAGDYTFICSVIGHEQLGLKGTMTVK